MFFALRIAMGLVVVRGLLTFVIVMASSDIVLSADTAAEFGVERHPWPPFLPDGARLLMLGTFPPKPSRWSMDFFYPNPTNDMWRIVGLVFFGDRDRFWDASARCFREAELRQFLAKHGIALWDTAMAVRRLRDNASDRFLDIVEPLDLAALLRLAGEVRTVVTTGEKATGVVARQAGCAVPPVGVPQRFALVGRELTLWRMPSSSRAYPLSLDRKAAAYAAMFREAGFDVVAE